MSKKSQEILELYKSKVMPTYSPSVVLASGKGVTVRDVTLRDSSSWSLLALDSTDITVENVKTGFRINALGEFREGPPPQNVIVRNCRVSDTAEDGLIVFQNLQKSVSTTASIGSVRIEDCAFSNVRKGPAWIVSLADSVFEDVTLDGKPMPISYFKSCKGNVVK